MVWKHYWERKEPMYTIFEKPYMCQHCGQYTTTPHWAVKDIGRSTMQYAFCNEDHALSYWLNLLRRNEGAPVDDPSLDI